MTTFQPSADITFFAETNYRNKKIKFGIKKDDRRRHMYVIGKTGMGKTTLLENMVLNDIYSGAGLAYVDPHGDSVEKFLDYIPSHRVNDVIYFNPSDLDYPIAFNILEQVDPSLKHIVASGLLGVFKKLWADSWGPRLEYLLRNAILALLDYPGSTLLGVLRVLTDKVYRNKVIAKIKDPVVKSFWVDEFSKYPDKFAVEAIAPIQNKVGQFLSNFLIRNIVGQVTSSFDVRQAMDEGKILLLNLSKGKIGEDTSALLGAMMITKIQLAAMSRVDIPEDERRDFYLYVDEFQNFATESFANILSEARKYHLDLTIAHQYIEQLDEKVQAAVFGNVGTMISFRVGATDAELFAKEFAPVFIEEDMVNLAKAEIYLKLMIDGVASEPFSARGLPPIDKSIPKTEIRDKIIKVSRERYAVSRKVVEDKIIRWSGVTIGDQPVARQNITPSHTKPLRSFPMDSQQPSSSRGFSPHNSFDNNRGSNDFDSRPPRPVRRAHDIDNGWEQIKENTGTPGAGYVASLRSVTSSSTVPPEPRPSSPSPSHHDISPEQKPEQSREESAHKYLELVAQQQARKGVSGEKELSVRDPDGQASNRPHATQCHSCNKLTYVSFLPDGNRPVFCKNCLRDKRLEQAKQRQEKFGYGTDFQRKSVAPPRSAFIPQSPLVEKRADTVRAKTAPIKNIVLHHADDDSTTSHAPDVKSRVRKLKPGEVVKFP